MTFFCDQSIDEGGWTIIPRRLDGSVNVNHSWAEYRHGFGKIDGKH